jgi:hypothetical protein
MANIAARLILTGTVMRIDASDMPASADGRFAARRSVKALVLTDGGGFAEVTFSEPNQASWAERSLDGGSRVNWTVDLADGRSERGQWFRISFVNDLDTQPVAAAS